MVAAACWWCGLLFAVYRYETERSTGGGSGDAVVAPLPNMHLRLFPDASLLEKAENYAMKKPYGSGGGMACIL